MGANEANCFSVRPKFIRANLLPETAESALFCVMLSASGNKRKEQNDVLFREKQSIRSDHISVAYTPMCDF